MGEYSIKDMEMLSNIKAHTIRIWEQRYNLFTPERTETNIRYYTDEQLKRLLNVCTLINGGMKISHISKLSNAEIRDAIDKMMFLTSSSSANVESMISQAIAAISAYDQHLFEKVFSRSINKLGFASAYLELVYPMLIRIGMMWSKDDIIPAQEHFLSNLLRQKLFAAIDKLSLPESSAPVWVLFLDETEKHEIGLLFAWYILRLHGQNVIYLGQEVPYENLSHVIRQCKPSYIYTFLVRKQSPKNIGTLLNRLQTDFVDPTICISGSDEVLGQADTGKSVWKSVWINDLNKLVTLIKNACHA
jgi:MerR family transcriptional regulator, light-induced transcriptional regulator